MKVLILGCTGMLGQSLMAEAVRRGHAPIGVARSGGDIRADITNDDALRKIFRDAAPDVVINTVAIVSLDACEKDPARAYLVNARPASILAAMSASEGRYFVQISTDHYYCSCSDLKHDEDHPVVLVNEYARTKYAAECFTLALPGSLVVRTNIVGFRSITREQPTFAEWVFKSLADDAPITMFRDFYTSSVDVTQFSSALFDLAPKKPSGILNVASRDVRSKQDFIEAIARRLDRKPTRCSAGSIAELQGTPRAACLGLNVTKAEHLLGYNLPTFDQVIDGLVKEYREATGS